MARSSAMKSSARRLAARETIEAFQTASGLCVPAEEKGGDPGGVEPRHVKEHVHALAKRIEELENVIVRRYIPDIFDESERIATRRAGRANG